MSFVGRNIAWMQRSLCIALILLFSILSLNAYACLLPTPERNMADGLCPTSETESAVQFCDSFKTLAVQSLHELWHEPLSIAPITLVQTIEIVLSFNLIDLQVADPPLFRSQAITTAVLRI